MDWQTVLIIYAGGYIATLNGELLRTTDYEWQRYGTLVPIITGILLAIIWPVYVPLTIIGHKLK